MYLKAVAYEHQGNHPKALQYYNIALRLDDEIADAHKKRAIYEQELKQWQNSVKDLNAVLRLTPTAFVIYKIRGTSYFYLGQFNEAIADFTTYLKHDSTDKEVLNYRGATYLAMKNRIKAYIDFADAMNTKMLNFKDMTHLVDSVLATGDTTKTLLILNLFTKSQPYFSEGFVRKFKLYLEHDQWEPLAKDIFRAVENCRSEVSEKDYSYLVTIKAMKIARSGNNKDALTVFDQAIKSDKNNALAYLERGKLWNILGKHSKAENDLKKSVSLGNKEAEQLLNTGFKK